MTYSNWLTDSITTDAVQIVPELTNPQNTPTGDGATLTIDSNSDAGTLYSYSKTTPFTGTEADAAEIIANGVGQAPVVGTNTRVVTDQDGMTDHYAGWVQDSDPGPVFHAITSEYLSTGAGSHEMEAQRTGAGAPAFTHSGLVLPDYQGADHTIAANAPPWYGARWDYAAMGDALHTPISGWSGLTGGDAVTVIDEEADTVTMTSTASGIGLFIPTGGLTVGQEYRIQFNVLSTNIISQCRVGEAATTTSGVSGIILGSGEVIIGLNSAVFTHADAGYNYISIGGRADVKALQLSVSDVELVAVVDTPYGNEFVPSYTGTIFGDSFSNGSRDILTSINSKIPESFTRTTYAVAGSKLAAIRAAFDTEFVGQGTYVVIQGGINDLSNAATDPNAAMRAEVTHMMDVAIASGLQVIILNVAPWKGSATWTSTKQAYTDSYNAWVAATYPEYVSDMYAALEDPANPEYMLPEYASVDLLHPEIPEGYGAIDDNLIAVHFNNHGIPLAVAPSLYGGTDCVTEFDGGNHKDESGGYYLEVTQQAAGGILSSFLSVVGSNIQLSDGTTTTTSAWVTDTPYKIGVAYGSSMALCVDGVWSADLAYDGTLVSGALDLFRSATGTGIARNIQRYEVGYDAAKAKIAGLMT